MLVCDLLQVFPQYPSLLKALERNPLTTVNRWTFSGSNSLAAKFAIHEYERGDNYHEKLKELEDLPASSYKNYIS